VSSVATYHYKIEEEEFPAPIAGWEDPPIVTGLNILPIMASYKIHRWTWRELPGVFFEKITDQWKSQQTNGTQLSTLETDPFGVEYEDNTVGTVEYTDFVIVQVSRRVRGLPHYDNVSVVFEVYVDPTIDHN